MLNHLAPSPRFTKRRTALQGTRLLEQGFLRVNLDRPSALTAGALGS
jgi:hypothetical protein